MTKLDPVMVAKMDELIALAPEGYRAYSWQAHIDSAGITYSHTASDALGNSMTVNERRPHETSSPK